MKIGVIRPFSFLLNCEMRERKIKKRQLTIRQRTGLSHVSIDPKSEKYYSVSPYTSMNNNPVSNIDPLGDDWFVNNTNGEVVYLKGTAKVTQKSLEDMGSKNSVNDYERLGGDFMFGKELTSVEGTDILGSKVFRVGNSEAFMKGKGYNKVLKQTIEEKTYIDKSFDGGGFDAIKIETAIPLSKEVLDSDISYLKSGTKMGKVQISSKTEKQEFTNSLSLKTEVYKETTPAKTKGNGNSKTENSAGSNLGKTAIEKGGESLLKILKKK